MVAGAANGDEPGRHHTTGVLRATFDATHILGVATKTPEDVAVSPAAAKET